MPQSTWALTEAKRQEIKPLELRACIVQACAGGKSNNVLIARQRVTSLTVIKRRHGSSNIDSAA
ncbi:hypothetical protein [Ottowia thiooxydans]|uniref:hypothetical protein n=1 Tax=Ottowia thiooxydans TaxID=219182 RepID=UPI0003F8F25D|nr:hypothetical protein [Ottowia thiooxydans]